MARSALASAVLGGVAAVLLAPASARGGDPGTEVAWTPSLEKAFEEAKASRKPLFIAINARVVEGEGVEVASRLLREQVYRQPQVVERSRAFVCVFLEDPLSTADGGELRSRFGIDGMIVSPQHLFAHADGALIQRKEYWEPRDVAASVEALGAMMTRALKAHEVRLALPPLGEDAASRSAWIAAAAALARAGPDVELRRAAARELAAADRGGDGLAALQALLPQAKEAKAPDVPVFAEIACLLGRPGLEAAVPGLSALLDAKDPLLRSHGAVSLEHVGSAAAVEALLARLAKEKDEGARAHMLRAAGRCGPKDPGVRKQLLRDAQARAERVAVGALVGLGYLEGDAEAARALEKATKGSDEGVRRVASLWALVEIGDARTAAFLRTEAAETSKAAYSLRLVEAALACFEGGREERKPELDQGLRWSMSEKGYGAETVRGGRTASSFVPKGDFFAPAVAPPDAE
jgi:hypothetical protein